jgi:hypothetical protein
MTCHIRNWRPTQYINLWSTAFLICYFRFIQRTVTQNEQYSGNSVLIQLIANWTLFHMSRVLYVETLYSINSCTHIFASTIIQIIIIPNTRRGGFCQCKLLQVHRRIHIACISMRIAASARSSIPCVYCHRSTHYTLHCTLCRRRLHSDVSWG